MMLPESDRFRPVSGTFCMMTSSNGNIFRVTGHLCGEFADPGEFPAQRPVTRSFDVFFDLRLNKRLSKQSWGWWFESPSWSLWRHCNDHANSGMWLCHCSNQSIAGSDARHGVLDHRQLDYLFDSFFGQTTKLTKICISDPLWGNSPVTGLPKLYKF